MVQQNVILPVRCLRCNAVFDLWYDLNEQEEARRAAVDEEQTSIELLNQSLCWNCRNETLEEEKENRDLVSESFEMEIDFE